jgi:hypothetical protein
MRMIMDLDDDVLVQAMAGGGRDVVKTCSIKP